MIKYAYVIINYLLVTLIILSVVILPKSMITEMYPSLLTL